jgi:hypothetical protein
MPNIYDCPEAFGLTAFGDVDFSSGCYEFDRIVVWKDDRGQLYYAEDSGCSCPEPFGSFDLRNITKATPHQITERLQAKAKERDDAYGGPDDSPGYGHDAMTELIARLMNTRNEAKPA